MGISRRAGGLSQQNIEREISDCRAGFTGTLRISLSPSMSMNFISTYLVKFSELYPAVNYDLFESSFHEQMNQLLNGDAEIAVANAPLPKPHRFETILRRKEQLSAVFKKGSRYLRNEGSNILLEDLEEIPLCLSRGCAEMFLSACSDSRIYPRVLSVTTTKLSALAWLVNDGGVAVIPITPEELLSENYFVKKIQDDRLYMEKTLSIVKDRQLSTVAKQFIRFVMNNYSNNLL